MLSETAADAVALALAAKARKPQRLWWLVHHWIGLKLSIFTSFVLFTGTLAVLSYEIDWLIFPQMRVDAASVQGAPDWPAMARSVHAYAPDAEILRLDAPLDPWFAARATIERSDGGQAFVFAHPTTGAVTGETATINVARILRHMHRHLFMPVKIGVPIVTMVAFLLLVSLVTSFVVYKKWWRGFFRIPRLADARTFLGDLHRLAGVWSMWFVALMIATGVWYLLENVAIPAPPAPTASIATPAMTSAGHVDHLGPAVEAARNAWPDLRVAGISFPVEGRSGFVFQGQDDALLVRARANSVSVDAITAEVKLIHHGDQLSFHQRIAEAADPLHFGDFGGLGTKLIWFVFGLCLTGLSVSGVSIYALRLARRGPRSLPEAPAESPSATPAPPLKTWWRGMSLWRWLALALVAAAFILAPFWNY